MKIFKASSSVNYQCTLAQTWLNCKALPETGSSELAASILYSAFSWLPGVQKSYEALHGRFATAVIMLRFVYKGPLKWSQCLISNGRAMGKPDIV